MGLHTAVMMGSFALAILQAVQPDATFSGQAERLGLVGALLFAVGVLWRKLDAKDQAQSEAQIAMAKAFVANTEVMRELKETVSKLSDTVSELCITVDRVSTVRDALSEAKRKQ